MDLRAPSLARTCWLAWSVPPEQDAGQVTHAVRSGSTTAVCGASTSCQGAPWPEPGTPWDHPLLRCENCDTALTGTG